jgi:shikimate dehydrogenase
MNIDATTHLLGLLGWPVAHSLSPAMHNAAAADLGLNLAYLPLPVAPAALPEAVRGLAALGFRGVNVTVPHKTAILPLLAELTDDARAIGAANTLARTDGGWRGHNTDWSGFLADLRALDLPLDGRDCLVLGAGGSARAVVYALRRGGGRVTVLARRPEQAAALAADLAGQAAQPGALADLPGRVVALHAPLIVNTTPLGLAPDVDGSPWPDDLPFPRGAFAYDLVYNPARTRFMAQAEAGGGRAANGLGMLVGQAAEAFALWTGRQPDPAVMRRAAVAALAQPQGE